MNLPENTIAADTDLPQTINCKNCAQPLNGKFCANCGTPAKLKRVDGHYLSHEIQHVLHFEKGILYTVKELLTAPGKNVRRFIVDDRSRLVKPVIFIIITSLVYSSAVHFFHVEDGYTKYSGDKTSTITALATWVQGHYGYANIMMGMFIALWIKLFFKRQHYNFFEILILLCFVMGMGMLIFAIFTIAEALLRSGWIMQVASIVGIGYCIWAIGQFFNSKGAMGYVKALIAYVLGMISFWVVLVILGSFIDHFIKH